MPVRAFTVKPMERSLPRRDWRWIRSQSILVAMEVFSWRSGPVGCGRTEDRPLQRSKTSSGCMSQSCSDCPGQVLCQPTSTQVIQGSNCLSIHRYLKAVRPSGSRWCQPGQTGSVALFERGEHQIRLVRVKQEENRTRLAKTQLGPYQSEIKLTLCGLGWV